MPLVGPFQLLRGNQYLLGRVETSDLCIPIPTVSSRHAVLVVQEDQVLITDLQSTNGTWVRRPVLSARERGGPR